MRTRNADNPKSPPPAKKTPPARKPTPPLASQQSPSDSSVTPKRASSTRGKAVATATTTPVEAVKVQDEAVQVAPGTKSGNKKIVKRVVKRTVIKKKPKSVDSTSPPAGQENLVEVKDAVHVKQEELSPNDVGTPFKDDKDAEDTMEDVEDGTDVQPESVEDSLRRESSDAAKTLEDHEPEVGEKENMETDDEEPFETEEEPGTEVEKEMQTEVNEDKVENNELVDMEKGINEDFKDEEDPQERLCLSDEEKDKDISTDGHDEEDDYEPEDVKVEKKDELRFQEHELTEAAEERKRRKEFEVFVGGLDRDATEEDLKRVFQNAGEVVEVRMHKEQGTNKNKGYAFVKYATKEHVARALAEMKNPVIRGKRCGTAPSEHNDTLFLGNVCNTWTKEDIREKLKKYGIEGVERITVVPDPQHEELSRGFAFLEFSGQPDAMVAFKRLQKPDAIFGHPDRTAKVAFAEPLREPDAEVLAQVKSVFVDGLPPHWDEDIVRDHLKTYGTIERVMLARNMSTAKRKDFGFIDFTTHDAALACIDGINKRALGDDKMVVRARLSNPLPKTQAVKGAIAGGFLIGSDSGATFTRAGRGSGRGALTSNRMNSPRGRGFHHHGPDQTRGMGFADDYPPHPPFRGRHSYGGRWDDYRGPYQPYAQGHVPPRSDVWHGADMPRDHSMPMRGQPYLPEEQLSRPYGGRPYEDPYVYGDTSRGMKRPYFADSDYTEPSWGRPRLDYSESAVSAPGGRYRDIIGDSGGPSRDYYNYDYSSYYGGERPYGGDRSYGGYGGDRFYGGGPYGDSPYGSDRPYSGGRPYGGRYHY